MQYLREEVTKTETLKVKEEQTLTEWQVGNQGYWGPKRLFPSLPPVASKQGRKTLVLPLQCPWLA